jgi:hypothetical protein
MLLFFRASAAAGYQEAIDLVSERNWSILNLSNATKRTIVLGFLLYKSRIYSIPNGSYQKEENASWLERSSRCNPR